MIDREMAVHYNGVVVGARSRWYKLDGIYASSIGYRESFVEFGFTVIATSHAEFVALTKNVENAFRRPHGRLQISLLNGVLVDLGHDQNTGFNAQPAIIKRGDDKDTGRSRFYRVRIDFEMPADTGAEEDTGLREATIDQAYSSSRRRTVTFGGLYTATGTTSARAQYEGGASDYCDGILSGFGGTFELVEEPQAETDAENKTCQWQRVYEEVKFAQSSGSTNDAAIVRQDLRIQRRRLAPGDTFSTAGGDVPGSDAVDPGTGTTTQAVRLVEITANYSAWLRSDQTTDIKGKYESTIKPWIVSQVEAIQDGTLALIDEQLEPQYDDNRISAVLIFHVNSGGGDILEREVTIEDMQESGLTRLGVWSGNPLEKYEYQRPTKVLRTTTVRSRFIGVRGPGFAANQGIAAADAANSNAPVLRPGSTSGTRWGDVTRTSSATPKLMGLDGYEFATTEIVATVVRELFKPRQGGTGGAITGGGPAGEVTQGPGRLGISAR